MSALLAPVRLSASDRLARAVFGVVVGGAAAWASWCPIGGGEALLGLGVSPLAPVCVVALWSADTGRWGRPRKPRGVAVWLQ